MPVVEFSTALTMFTITLSKSPHHIKETQNILHWSIKNTVLLCTTIGAQCGRRRRGKEGTENLGARAWGAKSEGGEL